MCEETVSLCKCTEGTLRLHKHTHIHTHTVERAHPDPHFFIHVIFTQLASMLPALLCLIRQLMIV